MAVTKINGFRAPYRSLTFRDIADAQTQRNGVVTMSGVVSQAGPTITVPAFTFVQQGLLVKKTAATLLTAPTMDAPYYLVVSAPTSNNVDDLIFTFAKSPADLTVNEAVVAAWDGEEWRLQPFLSFDGVYDDVNQANIDFDLVGPFSGVTTAVDGGDYRNSAGVVVDRQGLRQRLTEDVAFPIPLDDPDWGRVDRVLYRRPADAESRIGMRRFFVGGAYAGTPTTLYNTQAFDSTLVRRNTKVLVDSDNSAHLFTATGYGDAVSIYYRKMDSDRTTELVAPTDIITDASDPDFDVAIDSSGNLYVVYVSGLNIKWRKFNSSGAPLTAGAAIDAQAGQCLKPRIAIDPQNTRTYVVYQSLVAVSQYQIFFVSVELGGSVATASKNITSDAFNQTEPSLAVTDDFLVYVAWTNSTLGKITYRVFDDIGDAQLAAVDVSAATEQIGVGTLVNVANSPKIWVTDNKEIRVAFLQDKGGSVFGLSIWSSATAAAFMQELVGALENFARFDVWIDPIFNDYHIVVAQTSQIDFVKMRGQTVDFSLALAATGASGLSTTRDVLGAMLTLWSSPESGTYSSYAAAVNILNIGSTTVIGGVNNANLANDQFLMGVGTVPAVGDQVIISGSTVANDGTYVITGVTLFSLNALDDRYVVTVDSAFAAAENPAPAVFGDFSAPDGNESRYVKSTAETEAHAYVLDKLDTDVLLARIVTPGPVILNYPVAGSGGSTADLLLPFGAAVSIDWESTSAGELTISGGLKVLDLLNNFTYALVDGGFPMVEGDALYVELDGIDFNPTPQVTSVATLPFGLPIHVLGAVKDGEFNPHLLARGGMEQLDSGEAIVFGQDLSDQVRAKLGITSETTVQAYTSALGPTTLNSVVSDTDTFPEAIKKLDGRSDTTRKIRLVDLVSTALPSGVSATIDGVSVVNGDEVLFTDSVLNGVYRAAGVGVAITWTQLPVFGNSTAPVARSSVAVQEGTDYLQTIWQYDMTAGWKPLELATLTKEPTGFLDRTESLISFDSGTRTFEVAVIGDHFDYLIKGKVYRKDTAQSVVIPDTVGIHYIYFDGDTLTSSIALADDLSADYAFVGMVLWDSANGEALLVGDERHGLVMDEATRKSLHQGKGAQVRDGFEISNYTTTGSGVADADAQLALSDGYVVDEDLNLLVQHAAVPTADFEQILSLDAELPVFYRDGGAWVKDVATAFPVKQGAARIQWNDPAGPWSVQDATADGYFVAMWVIATNSIEEPIIAVLGQNEWTSLNDARENETYESLLLGDLDTGEMKAIYRLIFETHSAFANTPKAALRDVRDLRELADSTMPAASTTTDVSEFDGALSAADTNVQKALETLDDAVGAIQSNNPKFYREVVAAPATVFNVSGFTFDALNTILDIELLINGKWYPPCTAGDFSTGAWRKNSTSQIETEESIPVDAEVVVWKQGTSSGGGGGGTDLENITVDPQPAVAATQSLGTLAKPWSGLYIKDTATSQVYLLQITNGIVDYAEVP